jgi:hypothetical protein
MSVRSAWLLAWSPLLLSPQWRVQPGETALQDCPAPGRRPSALLFRMAARMVAALIMSGAFFSSQVFYEEGEEAL